jgi:hypothetical protein
MPIVGSFAGASARAYGASAGSVLLGDFESIATVTLANSTTTFVDFTSIPQNYTHLQIRGIVKSSINSGVDLTFNSDTGNNYTYHQLAGNGASAFAEASLNRANCAAVFFSPSNSETVGYAGGFVDILDFANTNKFKTVRCLGGFDGNGQGSAYLTSGAWRSTSAVTSLRLSNRSGNFIQYTSFALYGVKA